MGKEAETMKTTNKLKFADNWSGWNLCFGRKTVLFTHCYAPLAELKVFQLNLIMSKPGAACTVGVESFCRNIFRPAFY